MPANDRKRHCDQKTKVNYAVWILRRGLKMFGLKIWYIYFIFNHNLYYFYVFLYIFILLLRDDNNVTLHWCFTNCILTNFYNITLYNEVLGNKSIATQCMSAVIWLRHLKIIKISLVSIQFLMSSMFIFAAVTLGSPLLRLSPRIFPYFTNSHIFYNANSRQLLRIADENVLKTIVLLHGHTHNLFVP